MNVSILPRAAALLVCLVAAATTLTAQPVTDGTVNAAEYAWSSGDWRMDHDATYLYFAKVAIGTGGIVMHLDTDPQPTPTAGSSGNGNLDASISYGAGTPVAVKLPFRGDAQITAGAATTNIKVRDGSGGWTFADAGNVTMATVGTAIEARVRWDAIPGLTGRPSAFNWTSHQVIDVGAMTMTSNPMPSQNTSGGSRIQYLFHVANATADTFGDTRSTWLVTDNADTGTFALRSAIGSANGDTTSTRRYISFDLGTPTINLASALPAITSTVTLDGTSQPGYTNQPLITLIGLSSFDGVTLTGAVDAEVRGLALRSFTRGIEMTGGSGNTIAGNWIGVTAGCATGIHVYTTIDPVIGGVSAADANVIVNNTTAGIALDSTQDAQILRNYIGVDSSEIAAPNFVGIDLVSTTNTVIGATGNGNVISGNTSDGVHSDTTAEATIVGNFIGVASDGLTSRPNGGDAIEGTRNLLVGSAAAPNIIANNGGAAVRATVGNILIRFNSIYDNGSNIVLTGGQPVPTVTRASVGDGTTLGIELSLSSNNTFEVAQSFRIDLYEDDGGPKTYKASTQCFDQPGLNGFQWTVGTGYSASTNYFLIATSFQDFTCTNPADGSSQALSIDPTTGSTSTVSLQSSASTGWVGGMLNLTATVTASPSPTGTVTFREDGNPIANCTSMSLNSGSANCLVTHSSNGTKAYTALYNGDAFNATSTSNTANVTVKTHTFTGTGLFSDAARWTDNVVPSPFEAMRIEGTCTYPSGVALHYGLMEVAAGGTMLWATNHLTALRVAGITGAGTVDMTPGGNLEVGGLGWTGVSLVRGLGTVTLTANSALPALDFHHLVVSGAVSGGSSAVTVYGSLTVTSGASFQPGVGVTMRGDITNGGTLTFSTLSIPSGATVNASGTFNAGAAAVEGTLIPTASTIVNATSVDGAGTIYVTSTTTPDSMASQYITPSVPQLDVQGLTVYFNGAAAQSIDSRLYGGITVDNTSGVTLAGTVNILSKLYLKSGVLTTSSFLYVNNGAADAITWLNGWIVGTQFERQILGGTNSYTFPVGLGTHPAFITVTFHNVTLPVNTTSTSVSVVAQTPASVGSAATGNGLDSARDANVFWKVGKGLATSWDFGMSYAGLPDIAAYTPGFAFRWRPVSGGGTWSDAPAVAFTDGISAPGVTYSGSSGTLWITAGNQLPVTTTSQITAANSQIVNNGTSSTTITVQLRDELNVELKSGGDTVTLATNLGSLGAVSDQGNGLYTATLTAGTTAGTATVTGTVNSAAIADNAQVVFDSIATPSNVMAIAVSASSVAVSWNAVGGATQYAIERSASGSSSFTTVGMTSAAVFMHNPVSPNTSYLYRVRAFAGAEMSAASAPDLATTVIFTNSSLTGVGVKVVHFNELLTAVNAVRTLAGMGPVSFTSPVPASGVTIRKTHVEDLRTALTAARTALGLSTSFTDPTLTTSTVVKAVHLTELRGGVQ